MLENLKKKLYFIKHDLLINEGIKNGDIMPFEEDLYERLSKIYFNGYPMSLQIKYLKPQFGPGQCQDRSLFITMGFDDALWVSGDNKDLEYNFGKKNAWHFWVEHNGWVYDPTLLYKFKKEVYYKIYDPTNLIYRNPEDYKKSELYLPIVNTTIDDLKPGGKERYHLCVSIPFIQGIAEMSGNQDFIDELNEYLELIEYDYQQISDELDNSIRNIMIKGRK